jgi:4-amino-4-deoxy-L-arabinose transferase-like glycosyltransferase
MLCAGVLFWRGSPVDVNAEHPPLAKALAALPVVLTESPRIDVDGWLARRESGFALGHAFMYESGVDHERLLALGRTPMVALATALVAVIGCWSWRLFGPRAGLLALALAAFDPNFVAYGSLVGNDVPLALFSTLALFAMGEFFDDARTAWLVLAGLATGCALVTKFSGLLVPAALVAAFMAQATLTEDFGPRLSLAGGVERRRWSPLASAGIALALVAAIAGAVVIVFYGPRGLSAFVGGVQAQLRHQSLGHRAFFLGAVSSTGWTGYFPLALAVKLPPLTLGLFAVSLAWLREGTPPGRLVAAGLVPLALMLLELLRVRVDIGVRYALPVLPILIVFASRVATFAAPWPRLSAGALALGLTHHVFAALRIAPHDIAFFSDLVGGPARGQLYL